MTVLDGSGKAGLVRAAATGFFLQGTSVKRKATPHFGGLCSVLLRQLRAPKQRTGSRPLSTGVIGRNRELGDPSERPCDSRAVLGQAPRQHPTLPFWGMFARPRSLERVLSPSFPLAAAILSRVLLTPRDTWSEAVRPRKCPGRSLPRTWSCGCAFFFFFFFVVQTAQDIFCRFASGWLLHDLVQVNKFLTLRHKGRLSASGGFGGFGGFCQEWGVKEARRPWFSSKDQKNWTSPPFGRGLVMKKPWVSCHRGSRNTAERNI